MGTLALPGVAAAGEVSVWLPQSARDLGPVVLYDSGLLGNGAGANDRVNVDVRQHYVLGAEATKTELSANGAPLVPDPDDLQETLTTCAFAAVRVVCVVPDADLSLGAGNDTVKSTSWGRYTQTTSAIGGAGDDLMRGGATQDVFSGDSGTRSRPGLADVIAPGAPGKDEFYGGGGDDFADYDLHPEPLTVSLDDVANDGVPGEGDNIHSDVENVRGHESGGTDTLIGNSANNSLSGSGELRGLDGADHLGGDGLLDGGAGADALFADGDSDTLLGGPGHDSITGRGVDTIDGGTGSDRIAAWQGDDVIDPGPGVDGDVDASSGNDLILAQDGESDLIDCGSGSDTVHADAIDELIGCETVHTS